MIIYIYGCVCVYISYKSLLIITKPEDHSVCNICIRYSKGFDRIDYGMVWYGMVWYGMVWYGIILFDI